MGRYLAAFVTDTTTSCPVSGRPGIRMANRASGAEVAGSGRALGGQGADRQDKGGGGNSDNALSTFACGERVLRMKTTKLGTAYDDEIS